MVRHIKSGRLAGVGAGLLLALFATVTQAASDKSARTPCFFINQWNGWKSPSPRVIYLGVNMHEVYRLDLAVDATQLDWPDAHLVSVQHGPDSICSAIDLQQLSVSDSNGFKEPLFPSKLTRLTPEEVAAIPKKYRPN